MRLRSFKFLPLMAMIVFAACGKSDSDQTNGQTKNAENRVIDISVENLGLLTCPGSCNLPDKCNDPETACEDEACWIPIACCHQIDSSQFASMLVNPESEGTLISKESIEALLIDCKKIVVSDYDSDSTTDTDIVVGTSEPDSKYVYYDAALFKGILALGGDQFYFYNARRGDAHDIIFKVIFNSGDVAYYDLSEPPPPSDKI